MEEELRSISVLEPPDHSLAHTNGRDTLTRERMQGLETDKQPSKPPLEPKPGQWPGNRVRLSPTQRYTKLPPFPPGIFESQVQSVCAIFIDALT